MTELVIEAHRRKIPIDHPYRSITREHLEYPTENVSFAYLAVIDKVSNLTCIYGSNVLTKDSFADKTVYANVQTNNYPVMFGRVLDASNYYLQMVNIERSGSDHYLRKDIDGKSTILASENVDLGLECQSFAFVCSGSTLKGLRWQTRTALDPLNLPSPTATISATDTDLQSGLFGARVCRETYPHGGASELSIYLLSPMTSLPSAVKIIEVEVTKNPIRPNLVQELVEVNKLTNIPGFLKQEAKRYEILKAKGFTDEEIKALLGYIPQHQVDLASVTWGTFDHKPQHNTMLITITSDNPYKQGAIQKQVEYAKSKGLKVLNPPKNYREACEQYRQLRKDFTEWLAGKDNYAYQTLGYEVLNYFQVADTYYGNIVEGFKPNAYKGVPDWEMRRTLNMWKEKLEKVNVFKEEAEKHLKKLKEVEKKGW